jgi:glycosyltransferase involved in cell wall biosynthesis
MSTPSCEVSILIPVYNARAFVGQAIDSALRQTFRDIEVIIVDDCSTDGSDAVIASYDDPRIRRFRNERNLGLVGNWNETLRHARGRYITMLHQDDLMEPENVARKIAALESSGLSWVASDCRQIDAAGEVLHEHWYFHAPALRLAAQSREAQFAAMFFNRNYLCFTTILWKREVTDTVGPFETKGGLSVDVYMWLKFLSKYRFAYLDERLMRYRWAQNESLKNTEMDWLFDDFVARRAFARDFSLPAYFMARLRARYGTRFLHHYLSSRLRGDARGADKMRRGLSTLWA